MDWRDAMIESYRRSSEWVLDWREEIEAIHQYAEVSGDPERVVPRLGPVLTVMARYVRTLWLSHLNWKEAAGPDHPDFHNSSNIYWGGQRTLAAGLRAHLELTAEQADWLSQALAGYEIHFPSVEARKRELRRRGEQPDP